jgi:hypothetical protein
LQAAEQERHLNGVIPHEEDAFELEGDDSSIITSAPRSSGKSSSRAILVPTARETSLENIDITVPVVVTLKNRSLDRKFTHPKHYIRYMANSYNKEKEQVDYDLDEQDDEWLIQSRNTWMDDDGKITEEEFELFIDRFEKATGLVKHALPTLHEILEEHADLREITSDKALERVYEYWKNKRHSRIFEYDENLYTNVGKPLLPHFEVPPDIDNPNPYVAFRPREREKPGKKSRKNDQEGFNRLTQLRNEMSRLRDLLQLLRRREQLKLDYYRVTGQIIMAEAHSRSVVTRKRKIEQDGQKPRKRKRSTQESDSERTEESEDEEQEQNTEPMIEMNLQEFMAKCGRNATPLFSFLVQMNKTKPSQPIDTLIQTKLSNRPQLSTSYRFTRLGRMAVDFDQHKRKHQQQRFADENDFGDINGS